MTSSPEVCVDHVTAPTDTLGESGHWDAATPTPSFLWVNTPGKQVKRYHPHTGKVTTVSTEKPVSFAIPCATGNRLLIAQGDRLDFMEEADGKQTNFVSLALSDGVVTNDAKCDSRGRLWLGTWQSGVPFDKIAPLGGIFSVTANGVVKKHAEGFKLCNGLGWSSDERTMYMVDTLQKAVFAFDFDITSGTISRQRKVLDVSDCAGMPDGMTVDADDKLWVAFLTGGRVARFCPQTGKELTSVPMTPTLAPTCPAWVGDQLDTLYVTTATVFQTPEQLAGQPHAGAVHRLTGLGVKGSRPHRFGT